MKRLLSCFQLLFPPFCFQRQKQTNEYFLLYLWQHSFIIRQEKKYSRILIFLVFFITITKRFGVADRSTCWTGKDPGDAGVLHNPCASRPEGGLRQPRPFPPRPRHCSNRRPTHLRVRRATRIRPWRGGDGDWRGGGRRTRMWRRDRGRGDSFRNRPDDRPSRRCCRCRISVFRLWREREQRRVAASFARTGNWKTFRVKNDLLL